MANKPHISFRPSVELDAAIRAAASKDRRPVSSFVANLVEDALAAKQANHQHSEAA
ncbi:hypothetical protein [Bradyrhizobium guangdongense]|uniref:Uncharacterized protein n=1 Tax=Bradyrhizobium guangdongense TaxID=1325090 RepID=A0AA88B7S8_9BRAD|nr:hypothetical protein [Bradyrhizobium guangdongense]GGI23783.1 hypothetical protein GCM10010987_26110 [Bradyrhizobium guangdongense]